MRARMWFGKNRDDILVQTDTDWAGREEGRMSISGGAMYVPGRLVQSWSKHQSNVADELE